MVRGNGTQPSLIGNCRIIRVPHTVHTPQGGTYNLIRSLSRQVVRQRNRANQRNRFDKHALVSIAIASLCSDHARRQTWWNGVYAARKALAQENGHAKKTKAHCLLRFINKMVHFVAIEGRAASRCAASRLAVLCKKRTIPTYCAAAASSINRATASGWETITT